MENSIKEIIDKINMKKDTDSSNIPTTYDFEEGGEGSLVFEYGENKKSEQVDDAEASEPISEEANESEAVKTPDVFVAADEKSSEYAVETPFGLFTAYVPRFTEASENYRMVDDPRPRMGFKPVAPRADRIEEENSADDATASVDPTAEIDGKVEDAVIVNMSTPSTDEEADRLNVFKFSAAGESEPASVERTVEQERAEINRLISGDIEPSAHESVLQEQPEQETVAAEEVKRDYSIPDPDSGIKVVDFEEKAEPSGISPEGVSEYVPDKKRGLVKEFELPIQRDRIKDKFLDAIMACRIRLGAVCFFALIILSFEICAFYNLFELSRLAVFTFSATALLIDLLLAASVFLLTLPETVAAFRALFSKKLVSDIALPTVFSAIAVYAVCIMVAKRFTYPLYGFMFALIAVFSVYATLCKLNADFAAFKLISGNGEKYILEKKLTRSLQEENYALDGLVDEYKSRTARIFRAAFVTDFFKRTSRVSESSSHNGLLLSLTFALSVIIGAISYFLADGLYSAFSSFTLVFVLGMPAFMVLSHKLPYKYAEEYAVSEDSAALGESAYMDFSDVDVICFEDSEIFGIDDVNLKRFIFYGDKENMESVMRKLCSLFSVVGGPLYSIFTSALDNRVRHNPAVNTVIEQDGLSGEVSGKLICAGSEEYMLRHGIAIPESAQGNERKNDTIKIMYAAEGSEICAKLYIRYSFSEEFTMLLPSLKEQGIIPLIYTSDPNLSNELLRRLSAGADCMRVMKRLVAGTTDEKLHNRVSSGMITVGDKINAINLVLLSKKYKRFSERVSVSELTAMSVGLGIGVLLSFVGISAIPAAFLGVWHILWGAVLVFSGRSIFLKEKKTEEKQDNNG